MIEQTTIDRLEREYPDVLRLFRDEHYYRAFGANAVTLSRTLGLARAQEGGREVCSFPFHHLDGYLMKLVKSGLRVAMCEPADKPSAHRLPS